MLDTISISNQTPLPGNSQHTYAYDSTLWNDGPVAAAAAATAPGKSRGQLSGRRITGVITPTGQTVTVVFEILVNPAGTTSGAWATDANGPGGGSVAVVTTQNYAFSWLPVAPDHRIRILAGATAPTTLWSALVLTPERTSGA